MKKIMKSVLIIVLLIPVSFVSLFIIFPIINNIDLNRFEKQLVSFPLPEDTLIIETKSVVGKLNGNGNSIDFFTGMLIQSKLTKKELLEHYSEATFTGAKEEERTLFIEILPAESDELISMYLEHRRLHFSKLINVNNLSGYYFVTIYDGGYPASFDIRGN